MHRFVFACLVLALVARVGWAEGENAQCGTASGSDADYTITPCNLKNNEVFNMVVIGDSIAWGNGLNRKNKYSYLVAYWLQEKLNRPVEVTVYAHSGAAIAGESGKSIDPNLNSESPTLMDQAKNIKNKDDVDLILVSGGINDVGIQNIMDANTPAEDIERLSASIGDDMTNLLTYLLDETDAKIIVTGYYPIITEESKVEIQDRGVAGLLALTSEKTISQSENVLISAISDPTTAKVEAAWYLLDGTYNNAINLLTQDAKLRANSDTFYSTSSNSLDKAVKDADKGQNCIKFIDPLFERKNSYRAGSSFLWELNSDLKTNDFQYQERADLVEKTYPLDLNPLDQIKRAENKINPIAHPNRKGAAKYADTIKAVIDGEGLSWLHNSYPTIQSFQVTPQSLILGESFTIDYTVSDTRVSGLKQVELWRKDEQSDWQEVQINTLLDENGSKAASLIKRLSDWIQRILLLKETGPVSGSFTDMPLVSGKYWYGVHVVDNAGNWNDQKNSNTNGQPSSFEPVEVEVISSQEVTLTLYVHDGSADGPVLSGVEVTCQDAAGKRFSQTTDANGFVLLTGTPGIWEFTAAKSGYAVNSWSQEIAATCIKHAFLFTEEPTVGIDAVETQAPAEEWNRTFGGAANDWVGSVQITHDDGYILAGGTESFGGKSQNPWLIKTDAFGKEIWNETFEGAESGGGVEFVQPTDDMGFVAKTYKCGMLNDGIYIDCNSSVIKLDSQGKEVWRKFGAAIEPLRDGGYFVIYGDEFNLWLISTDSQGHEIWKKTISRSWGFAGTSIQLTSDDNFVLPTWNHSQDEANEETLLTWYWQLAKINSEGNKIWERSLDLKTTTVSFNSFSDISVYPTTDDGYILAGWMNFSEIQNNSITWLIKTNDHGDELWRKTFNGYNIFALLQPISDGGCIFARTKQSSIDGNNDSLLTLFDAQGNEAFSKRFDGEITAIQLAADEGYIVACTVESDEDAYSSLMRLDTEGNEVWSKVFSGIINGIKSVSNGGYILTGSTSHLGAGGDDVWLIKIS